MDYRKFAASWGIKDNDLTRKRVIRENWDNPSQYSSRLLLGIGEEQVAKEMALRAVINFDNYAIPLAQLLKEIDNGTQRDQAELNESLMKYIQGFGHFTHNIHNLRQSCFRGTAIDALIKLDSIKNAKSSVKEWAVFIDNSESFLYDPELYAELTKRFPELVKVKRYGDLYEKGDYNLLLQEFPKQKIRNDIELTKESFQDPFLYDKEIFEAQWKNQKKYYDDLWWTARKIVECYEVCQTCPEYQLAKTEGIMIGIRNLVQRLIAEQSS